ncbi:hypothetical protein AUEXF2481DRAFT_34161 [Aureobasidium subglaciale EXF-2481]|uniref:AttH domain-containing protein n=1 Tax=Aureobasidium subglaciale (strain EXF-2481) TaxID=1043005 RepID=A0A074Y7M9_AURSE|nr:uncharacterized protein AUEXF2481DRAFT_34161 [Aureobasidium subglaciale EXF-2481]KEQ90217.1 hypothetical protein AUEXF2481DRAFT_34161 [Aureobasidium subglaciale EXF-2481]
MLPANFSPFLYSLVPQWVAQDASTCELIKFNAFETLIKGPLTAVTGSSWPPAAPRFVHGVNATAGEQWAFDATSSDGKSGLLIGFYHDPTYAFLGPGNLRLSLDAVWPNGSTWSVVDYLSEAHLKICNQVTTGIWSKNNESTFYAFHFEPEKSLVSLEFHTPSVHGSITINSLLPARFPDGALESTHTVQASTFNAPAVDWIEIIPAGRADVRLSLDGTPFTWAGMGGAERWWAGQGWLDAFQGWTAVRAVLGPYVLTYWAPTSRLQAGKIFPSAFLARRGRKIFSASRIGPSMDTTNLDPYIEYRAFSETGDLVSSTMDPGTNKPGVAKGYVLSLVEPRDGKRWDFTLLHENMEFNFDLGNDNGGVAYVGKAKGGEVGDDTYDGVFFNEKVDVTKLKVPGFYIMAATWFHRVKAGIFGH